MQGLLNSQKQTYNNNNNNNNSKTKNKVKSLFYAPAADTNLRYTLGSVKFRVWFYFHNSWHPVASVKIITPGRWLLRIKLLAILQWIFKKRTMKMMEIDYLLLSTWKEHDKKRLNRAFPIPMYFALTKWFSSWVHCMKICENSSP